MALRHVHGRERHEMLANAISVLKRIVADKDGNAKDWYQLAQMNRMAGDRNACSEAIKEAMRRDEGNLFYVVNYVSDLLSDGRLDEAQPYLAQLLAATSDLRATEAAARFFAMSDLPARALEAVEKYTQAADAGTSDGAARVRQAAAMLDQAARAAAAKKLSGAKTLTSAALDKYRLSLKTYPEAAAPMSALLAFDGRASAALELLSSVKASLSAKMLTTAAVAVLRTGRATPQQFEQVKQWIDAALLENPGVSAVRLNLAELHALRQEYAVAEPMYRDALRGEPDNVVALNNLAWILAPRNEATAEALQYVERAIDISGPTGELLDTRARIFIARGDYEHAIEDSNEAIEETPTSLRYFHLALAQFKQLKKNEAEHSFKEARTRGLDPSMVHPNDVPAYKVMAAQMRE
jgi:cellulose synthase operon protein C